jgi:lipoprotein-anchoring transpeptidase ErfK/SrfK
MVADVSTGLDGIPTPVGAYEIFRKTPSRYMQGPIPGQTSDEYDLPGVPWTMYFTDDGAAIHGAYWHDEFGFQHSHGCVNLPLNLARKLYEWTPLGTLVIVQQ